MARKTIKRTMNAEIASPHRPTARGRLCSGRNLALMICLLPSLAIGAAQTGLPDNDALDEILARNVRNGFVDYDGIAADPRFAEYVRAIGDARPGDLVSGEARLAFYINAYNALAIQGILNGRSPAGWWSRRRFFKRDEYRVLGETISLEALEHERLGAFGEPRVHFAIVCASMSCPRLSSRAYRPESLDTELHEAAKRFVNDPTRNRYDPGRSLAFLSKIFEWYEDDFRAAGGSLQGYLARFAADARVQDLLRQDGFDLRFVDYDWNLNGRFGGTD